MAVQLCGCGNLDPRLCAGGGESAFMVARDRAAALLSGGPGAEEGCCEDPDAPAESLRLRIGEDIDWSDVGAAVLKRGDSTKGAGANPKSAAARRSAARRSASSPAAAPPRAAAVAVVIGGLTPGKAARAGEYGRRRSSSCRLGGGRARVFAAGESAVDRLAEPGSPKVSCLGGVRPEPRPAAAEGIIGGRRWWTWLAGDIISCCSNRGARKAARWCPQAD